MTRYFCCSLMLLAIPSVSAAQENDIIVVTANRTATPISKVGLSVSVIDAADIARLQTPGVPELLSTVPGLTVTRSGGVGTISSVFIRGDSADHTVALIDGVKLNDPSSPASGFDFGRLLTGNIERIEVVHGPQSVLWGSQAIGGVVNIIAKKPASDSPSAHLQGEYGYRDTVNLVGNAAIRTGPVTISGGATWLRTDGISAFSEKRGAPEPDGTEEFGGNIDVSVNLTDQLSADVRGWYSHSRINIDGYRPDFTFGDTRQYNRTREAIGYAGLNWNGLGGRWRNRVAYTITNVRRDDYNPDSTPIHQSDALGRNKRVELQSTLDIIEGWTVVAGVERERTLFTIASDYGFGATNLSGSALLTSAYGQLTATPVKGLTANIGLRNDHHSRFGSHTTFATNAAYTPNGGATVIRAAYGEGFKAPSLYQLYSQYGNIGLAPETAKSWEVGIVQNAMDGAAQLGVTWYLRKSHNLIDFVTCNGAGDPSPLCDYAFDGFYDNVASAKAHGIEVEMKLRPTDALLFNFNYSYVKSTDLSTGRDLARRPRHKAYASLDYRWPFGLSTGGSITHVSASYDSPYNSIRNADYVLTDVRVSLPLGRHWVAYARINNLFDTSYETVHDYGSPGRAGYIGLRMAL